MAARKQAPKKQEPAHPDLIPGLERLLDDGYEVGLPDGSWSKDKHPMYHEVLSELLAKKVPA